VVLTFVVAAASATATYAGKIFSASPSFPSDVTSSLTLILKAAAAGHSKQAAKKGGGKNFSPKLETTQALSLTLLSPPCTLIHDDHKEFSSQSSAARR